MASALEAEGRTGLVITGNVLELQQCSLYLSHRVPVLNVHHVVPESWWIAAGLPVASPLRSLCPECHSEVHCALDGLITGVDVSVLRARVVRLAQAGIAGAEAAGLTPARTL